MTYLDTFDPVRWQRLKLWRRRWLSRRFSVLDALGLILFLCCAYRAPDLFHWWMTH